jgi:hypothetical protein
MSETLRGPQLPVSEWFLEHGWSGAGYRSSRGLGCRLPVLSCRSRTWVSSALVSLKLKTIVLCYYVLGISLCALKLRCRSNGCWVTPLRVCCPPLGVCCSCLAPGYLEMVVSLRCYEDKTRWRRPLRSGALKLLCHPCLLPRVPNGV